MRLWTFQSQPAAEAMRTLDRYRASWDHVDEMWKPPIQWMVEAMEARGLSTGGCPPVWAWHRCGVGGGPPTLETARGLLSDFELNRGVMVVELDVPESMAVLSSYRHWNRVLDRFMGAEEKLTELLENVFRIGPEHPADDIQASLPFVERVWVMEVRSLKLRTDDASYDANEPA